MKGTGFARRPRGGWRVTSLNIDDGVILLHHLPRRSRHRNAKPRKCSPKDWPAGHGRATSTSCWRSAMDGHASAPTSRPGSSRNRQSVHEGKPSLLTPPEPQYEEGADHRHAVVHQGRRQ
jgi:hypothetical protein